MLHPDGARRDREEAEVLFLKKRKRHSGQEWREMMGGPKAQR